MNDADKTKIIRLEQLEEFKVKNDAKYATKVSGATANNFAALDANGNLKDSGKSTDDFISKNSSSISVTDSGGKMEIHPDTIATSYSDITFATGITGQTPQETTLSSLKAKYTKPSTGIPKTDLASAVQASLDKADTALQAADISGKADKSATVSNVEWDVTNKRLTKTINGTTTGIITLTDMKNLLNITKGDVGLGNVTNDAQVKRTEMGAANGVAQLDSTGKVPAAQLPSFVDDVIEGYLYNGKFYQEAAHTTEILAESGKIYVDITDGVNKTYRWSGTAYVEISSSLALGETSSTAYRGDRGKTAYDHSQSTHARTDATNTEASTTNGNIKINGTETTIYTHPVTTAAAAAAVKVGKDAQGHVVLGSALTKSDVGLDQVGNFKSVSTVASQGLTDTEKSAARTNIGAGTSSLTLGTSSSTAYRGDYGNTAYGHATDSARLTTAKESGLYKVAVTAQGHVASVAAVAKADITALGIPAQDTTYNNATQSAAGLMSAADKVKVDALVYATNSDIDALFA